PTTFLPQVTTHTWTLGELLDATGLDPAIAKGRAVFLYAEALAHPLPGPGHVSAAEAEQAVALALVLTPGDADLLAIQAHLQTL
ncbi:MAG: hypothetical protein KC656_21730, partial [Myxococcales bacterium]|nr:hypothetical protein [Myxococcales bacterium]